MPPPYGAGRLQQSSSGKMIRHGQWWMATQLGNNAQQPCDMTQTIYREVPPAPPCSPPPQQGAAEGGDWGFLPPELVAKVYAQLPLRDRKLGRRVCRGWQRGLDMMVTRLRVGPQTREPHAWNRQLLMMKRLPTLFPCLREIDFDQARGMTFPQKTLGVGSDLLVRDPGLPRNLDIIPKVPHIGVTSSRTSLHLAAVKGLAARPEVESFSLLLPSPVTSDDLSSLLGMLGTKLTALEVQQAHELSAGCLGVLAVAENLVSLSLEGIPRMGAEGWRAVACLRGLTRLAVRSRGDNAGLGQIAALTGLRDLRLKVRDIDADGVQALRTLTALRALDLEVWVSPVRPRVIEAMLGFTELEAVRLEAYSSLETARCFAALQHLPKLAHLDLRLSGSVFALEDNLEALACLARCSKLESLCIAAPAPTLAALAACSGITALRLSDASMLSNRITGSELPKLPLLRHLNLMHCCAVTDAGLATAAGLYPHLTSLQLKSEALTDAGLARLAALPNLERLELVDCEAVEGRGLATLLYALPRLIVMTVIGNDCALEAARRAAARHRPDCEVAKGRYPFELDNSLRPLQDRIYL